LNRGRGGSGKGQTNVLELVLVLVKLCVNGVKGLDSGGEVVHELKEGEIRSSENDGQRTLTLAGKGRQGELRAKKDLVKDARDSTEEFCVSSIATPA
jgi:hypothetical protein